MKVLLLALALISTPAKAQDLLMLGVIEVDSRLAVVVLDSDGKGLAFEDPLTAIEGLIAIRARDGFEDPLTAIEALITVLDRDGCDDPLAAIPNRTEQTALTLPVAHGERQPSPRHTNSFDIIHLLIRLRDRPRFFD